MKTNDSVLVHSPRERAELFDEVVSNGSSTFVMGKRIERGRKMG